MTKKPKKLAVYFCRATAKPTARIGTATAMSGNYQTATTTPPIRPTTSATAATSQNSLIYMILRNNFSSNAVPAATDRPA